MPLLTDVGVLARSIDAFVPLIGPDAVEDARTRCRRLHEALGPRVIWNVSTTAVATGVAEQLRSLVAYARGEDLDVRWVLVRGPAPLFQVAKRLVHALQGARGDGLRVDGERESYDAASMSSAMELASRASPGDVVVLHDPATAGMAPVLQARGLRVVWRCHGGSDVESAESERAWVFLRPYLARASRLVFSQWANVPSGVDAHCVRVVQPSIDPFSTKNAPMEPSEGRGILQHTGVLAGTATGMGGPYYTRGDGTRARVERRVDLVRCGPAVEPDMPVVLQVSRWDALKDMLGLERAFVQMVEWESAPQATLLLAGPNVHGVADDPDAADVYREVLEAWYAAPSAARARIQIAMLPTADVDENAAIVNALQRHASIVVQKSLAEGFGLTVAESMWKAKPVIASRVGGVRDQIIHRDSGILLDDPRDLAGAAHAIAGLLGDGRERERLGRHAKERVSAHFLDIRELRDAADVLAELIESQPSPVRAPHRGGPAGELRR